MKLSIDYLNLWFKDAIYHFAYSFETGIWDAEDIAQEVLLHLAQQDWPNDPTPSTFHGGRLCKTRPGLVNVAIRNKCYKIRRHESKRLSAGAPSKLLPEPRPSPASILALKEVILRLSNRQTRCVAARLFPWKPSEATMRQIAKETGYSLATVSRTLAEARELLESALLEECNERKQLAP